MNKHYSIPESCDFSTVFNNDTSPNECTPVLNDKFRSPFRGLSINAPREVSIPYNYDSKDGLRSPMGNLVSGGVQVPVAGLYNLPYSHKIKRKRDIAYSVVIVAVDKNSAQHYSGKLMSFGVEPKRPSLPPHMTEQEINDSVAEGYFNVDLLHNLKIPPITADYNVYAVIDEYKSNTVEISVTREKNK